MTVLIPVSGARVAVRGMALGPAAIESLTDDRTHAVVTFGARGDRLLIATDRLDAAGGTLAPLQIGQSVKALYLSQRAGTCLAASTVQAIWPHPDGSDRWMIRVSLPADRASDDQQVYIVPSSGRCDYLAAA